MFVSPIQSIAVLTNDFGDGYTWENIMTVGEIMSRDVLTITPDTSYRDIWKKIFSTHLHTLPVVDKEKKLVGILTRQDLLTRLYPNYQDVLDFLETPQDFEAMEDRIMEMESVKARDIMQTTVIFARVSTLVMRALSRMIVRHVDQLPILDDDDVVVGIVTKGDVFYSLFQKNYQRHTMGHRGQKKPSKSSKKKSTA